MNVLWVVRNVAALSDVPDWPIAGMFGIRVVGTSLVVQRCCIQRNEDSMDASGQYGRPHVKHVHDTLAEHQEHGEHHDDNVEVGDTASSQYSSEIRRVVTYNCVHTFGVVKGR